MKINRSIKYNELDYFKHFKEMANEYILII